MEQYLRANVNYQQDNWVTYLAMAEFAANNQFSETFKATPFMANYGFHPRFIVELHSQIQKKQNTEAKSMATKLAEIQEWLKSEMTHAQERQAEYTNASRLTAPRFIPGDKVLRHWGILLVVPVHMSSKLLTILVSLLVW